MPNIVKGGKFALAALGVMLIYARMDLGNSPFPAEYHGEIGWGIGVALAGIGWIIGPELLDIARAYVGRLAGNEDAK